MDPELQRAIASKGGKAAHQSGNAHRFTSEEAREAGRKGCQAAHRSSSARASRSSEDEDDSAARSNNRNGSHSAMLNAGGPRAQAGDQSGGEWPDSENEGRGRSHAREDQVEGSARNYRTENQGMNQGRNNFSTDQERAGRSAQGGSNRHASG
jgi:hypothetical protein